MITVEYNPFTGKRLPPTTIAMYVQSVIENYLDDVPHIHETYGSMDFIDDYKLAIEYGRLKSSDVNFIMS